MTKIEKIKALRHKLANKEYRDAYVSAEIVEGLTHQIRATRISRGWTQKELAEKLGTKQSVISRLENPDNEAFSIKMLEALASIFDVALIVRFLPFSKLAHETAEVLPEHLSVPRFDADRGFDENEVPSRASFNIFVISSDNNPAMIDKAPTVEYGIGPMHSNPNTPKRYTVGGACGGI